MEDGIVQPRKMRERDLAQPRQVGKDAAQDGGLDMDLGNLHDTELLKESLHQGLEHLLAALVVLHLANVRAPRLQLLPQRVTTRIAVKEAVREVDIDQVGQHGYGPGEVGLARLPRHVRELQQPDTLANVVVVAHGPAQLQQPRRRTVDFLAAAGLAPALFGIELLELAVVDGIDADAVVPDRKSVV